MARPFRFPNAGRVTREMMLSIIPDFVTPAYSGFFRDIPTPGETIAKASTVKISHLRILKGDRSESGARLFHNLMKEKTV